MSATDDFIPLRAVFFDFESLLANALPLSLSALRQAIELAAGQPPAEASLAAAASLPEVEAAVRTLAPAHFEASLAAYWQRYAQLHAPRLAPFASLPSLLRDLHAQGVRLGLVASRGAASLRLALRQLGLPAAIEQLAAGPAQEAALHQALATWQVYPGEAAYVGGAPAGLRAARLVGVRTVAWAEAASLAAGPALVPAVPGAGLRPTEWLGIAQRLQALAQAGLAYSPPLFDAERYAEVHALSLQMLANLTGQPVATFATLFATESGYPTPKVDIRAVLFRGTEEILLVQEKIDGGRWSLPGGWADVGYTPFEVAVKETQEETGLETEAVRLLALLDKKQHPHPPQPWYTYKAFIECRITGGQLQADTPETAGVRWVHRRELPQLALSTDRITLSQFELLFAFAQQPGLPALCD